MADVQFRTPDDLLVGGYLADTERPIGNVVVVHEWWGLNDQIRAICDRYAMANFRAFAPDLYDGVVVPIGDGAAAGAKMQALDWGKAIRILGGAVAQLRGMGGKVAVTGFCMGGALTLAAATQLGDQIDAAVPFYGIPGPEAGDPGKIRAPVLGHFAKKDDWITPAKVDALEATLTRGSVPHELHRYDASHAFFNEARKEVHDPAASKLAWDRTVAFLQHQFGIPA